MLGDDLLPSLKDIRDWLRHFNDKLNRLDVARLLAEANIVKGDLLEILAGWPDTAAEDSFRSKVALRCIDLLMQLTWPVDREEKNITQNLLFHKPYIQTAQTSYKQAILQHHTNILRKAARAGLPAMAQPQRERSPVEESIINVVLYFFRNTVMIQKPDHVDTEEDDTDISRSATIEAFKEQSILDIILAVGSGIGEEFQIHDLELLDLLFHLVKGIDVGKLFMEIHELMSSNTHELQSLIGKERSMHMGYARHAPSRHNRFGTMVWMKRNDGKVTTLMGQTATTNDESTLDEMDKAKKWRKPRRPAKEGQEDPLNEFNGTVPMSGTARRHLRQFIEQFLDSSFNPLFSAVRRSIEREVPRLQHYHTRQYFFLTSWFLRAETARRRKHAPDTKASDTQAKPEESFGLVASVLTQETFVLLGRRMQDAHDNKNWRDLNACMKCFTQILQTVQEMSDSPHEEDQEIAENTLSRIFYEQSTHDQLNTLLRTFKDQGFGYLDSLTDLAHSFMRTLERYSKQNVDMQVRTLKRSRKKKAAQDEAQGTSNNVDRELEAEDRQQAQRVSSERKFDFISFSAKMINQHSIETFVSFLKYYRELGTEQLKRAHRFFYRAAFKNDLCVYLFRLDIILLLQKIVRGPDGMDIEDPMFREWEELVRQLFRRLIKKMRERPALGVELLFSKIPGTVHFLEHGFEKEVPNLIPRPLAELEVKPGLSRDEQVGVAVSALINQSKTDHLDWIKRVLTSAVDERKAWEETKEILPSLEEPTDTASRRAEDCFVGAVQGEQDGAKSATHSQNSITLPMSKVLPSPILVRSDTRERRTALQKDKYLRLLMTLLLFEKLDITESNVDREGIVTSWTIPGSHSSLYLQESHDLIAKLEFSPPTYEDGKTAEAFLKRKYAIKGPDERTQNDNATGFIESDSEGDDEILFQPGGPSARELDHRPKKGKGRVKKDKDPLSNEALEERRACRRKNERAKAAKIKSELFITASDDEDDEERDRAFFEREAEMRRHQASEVQKQSLRLRGVWMPGEESHDNEPIEGPGAMHSGGAESSKRTFDDYYSDTNEEDEADDVVLNTSRPTKKGRKVMPSEDSDMSSNSDGLDALSQASVSSPRPQRREPPLALSSGPEESGSGSEAETPPSSLGHSEQTFLKGESHDFRARGSVGEAPNKENVAQRKPATFKTARAGRRAAVVESDSDD